MESFSSDFKSQTAETVVDDFRATIADLARDFRIACKKTEDFEKTINEHNLTLLNAQTSLKASQDEAARITKELEAFRAKQLELEKTINQRSSEVSINHPIQNQNHELLVRFLECNSALIDTNEKVKKLRSKLAEKNSKIPENDPINNVIEILNHQSHSLYQLYSILNKE